MAFRRRNKSYPFFSQEFLIQNHADIVFSLVIFILIGLMFEVRWTPDSLFFPLFLPSSALSCFLRWQKKKKSCWCTFRDVIEYPVRSKFSFNFAKRNNKKKEMFATFDTFQSVWWVWRIWWLAFFFKTSFAELAVKGNTWWLNRAGYKLQLYSFLLPVWLKSFRCLLLCIL